MRVKGARTQKRAYPIVTLIISCIVLSCLATAVLADDVLPLLSVLTNEDSDDDGLLSPLHSIFDFDGSDTTTPAGLASNPLHSFIFSFAMIIISELGDKTFLIAALMAMSHPRAVVFSAAFASLFVMTVLSAALGHAVPHLSMSITEY
jgi:hypothetical protein